MMSAHGLRCTQCGVHHPLKPYSYCPHCGGILDVTYDLRVHQGKQDINALFPACHNEGIWKYQNLLPVPEEMKGVSLGEGNTPLIQLNRLGAALGLSSLFAKNDTLNPTASFKDRPLAVGVSVAQHFGFTTVCAASTGNTGVATAAYAARAGLSCKIFLPNDTPDEKVLTILAHGADLVRVPGTFSEALSVAQYECERNGWFNLTSTFANPFALEGDKTIAYELVEQLSGKVPDWIVIPIGAGPLLAATFKGFTELKQLGIVSRIPKVVGVQAKNCAPIVEAFDSGADKVVTGSYSHTVASGIADPLIGYEQDGTYTLQIIRSTRGYAIGIEEDRILPALLSLAKEEGLYVEPSSATVIAAVETLRQNSIINSQDTVVTVLTGHGLKDNDVLKGILASTQPMKEAMPADG